MSVQHFQAQYASTAPIVREDGASNTAYGRGFLNALFQRTGGGTGIVPNVTDPLVATGATSDSALALTQDWNWVSGVTPGSGVMISPALNLKAGNDIVVQNAHAANSLNIYPPAGFQIDNLGANNPFVLAPMTQRTFKVFSTTQMFSSA